MAHRQEEKERRRQERLEREKAEKASAARRKRLQLALGGLVAIAAVAAVVVLLTGALGGDGDGGGDPDPASANVTLPEQAIGDLADAAEAASCKVTDPEIEGSTHETKTFTAADYKTNPPTSGNHTPPPASDDGVYEPGNTPELGGLVHSLEHGRIDVQYKTGTPASTVAQLEALLAEQSDGYHMLLFENTTNMDAAVAATAWGHSVTCAEMSPEVFDVLRTFRAEYIDQGPEDVP